MTKLIFKNILSSLLIILICNSVFFCISLWAETSRILVNIDYFLVLPFLFFKKRYLYILIFIIITFFDFMGIFIQIFHFIRLEDFIYLLKFSLITSDIYKFFGLMILFLVFVKIFIVKKFYNSSQNLILIIFFNLLILILVSKEFFYHSDDKENNLLLSRINLIVSSGLVEYVKSRNTIFLEKFGEDGQALQKIKKENSYINIKNNKILLIINESWGVPYDINIQHEVIKPILNLKKNRLKNFLLDEKEFSGFTIAAELRELCQLIPLHYNLKNQHNGFEECIPNLMRKSGYKTIAVHGALGLMYDRKYWYPRVGFSEILFHDSGLNLPYSRCFSFPGNCDHDIALRVVEKFKNNDKIFLYWLTLNTHAVYDKRDLKEDNFNCRVFNILEDSEVCRNLKLQRQFFSTLAHLVESSALNDSKVIVVGDHIPPLLKKENNIFVEGIVPKIEFNIYSD